MGIESVTVNWEESEASGMTSLTKSPRLEKTCGTRRTVMTALGLASALETGREGMSTLFGCKCSKRRYRVVKFREHFRLATSIQYKC